MEMSDTDVQVQAQEHIFRQTLHREKSKIGRHALEEVGRSLNAIAQRRRQYFLEYKECDSIRCVRKWCAWETKRNLETASSEMRTENAAIRGVKMFLHRVDFYGTLLARFIEYVLRPLQLHYNTTNNANMELEDVKKHMKRLKLKCETMLSDNSEISLENANHSDAEKRFPVISILPRLHDILNKMVMHSFQWRLHARYEQQFEQISNRRSLTESEQDLNEKKRILRSMEHQIRKTRRSDELLEEEMKERRQAIFTSNFPEEYSKCVDQIEIVRQALAQCKANIQNTDTAIKSVQQSFGKYKIVGAKKKHKLESSLLRRTRKVEELAKIKAELERLENHKFKLDEDEVTWLRGGYENAVTVIETLKEQSKLLKDNLVALEKQRDELKASYEHSMDQVLRLGIDFDQLSHKYEYVKRLAYIALRTLWNNTDHQITVKPNKITIAKIEVDEAYDMTQPKGVAMVILNDLRTKASGVAKVKPAQERPTTERKKDLGRALDALFIQFGYYVIQRSDLTAAGMRQHMIGLSDQYHGYQGDHNSLFVVAVAQSNERGDIIDGNGTVVNIKDLLEHFVNSRCPALLGKPKIFLFFLRVSVREPVLPMVDEIRSQGYKNQSQLSVSFATTTSHFEPDPISVDDDYLVVRIMYEDDASGEPTFGGSISSPDGGVPWFASTFVKMLSEQAGTTEILDVLKNIKREFYDQDGSTTVPSTTAQSQHNAVSPYVMANHDSRKSTHVNIFVDHALKKKLFIMPGI